MEAALLVFGGFALIALTLVLGSILRGWALSVLWGWFLVPFGAPELNIPTAIGVALLVSFLTHQNIHTDDKRSSTEKFASAVGVVFISPIFVLAIGWVVKQFL